MHQNYRNDGLGSKLFEQALQSARENHYKYICTGTMREKVKAQSFYKRHNFKKITKEELPLTFQTQVLDEKFYVLVLEF